MCESPREKWQKAYRLMRVVYDSSKPPTDEQIDRFSRLDDLHYRAFWRLFTRNSIDHLTISPAANLEAKKIIEEILAEEPTP